MATPTLTLCLPFVVPTLLRHIIGPIPRPLTASYSIGTAAEDYLTQVTNNKNDDTANLRSVWFGTAQTCAECTGTNLVQHLKIKIFEIANENLYLANNS